MSRIVTYAATQLTSSWDIEAKMDKPERGVRGTIKACSADDE